MGDSAMREIMQEMGHDEMPMASGGMDEMVGMDALFARADCLLLHAPSTPQTVGIVNAANIATMSDEDLHWLIDINLWGVVNGTRAFLPHLEASGEGHVVNLSSVFGLISVPSQGAYNIAKFGVRGFTDTLRMELDLAGSKVTATTVHPGGVKTNIARNARIDESTAALVGGTERGRDDFDRIARTTPDDAAKEILAAVERDRRRVMVGLDGKLIDMFSRFPAVVTQGFQVWGARLGKRLRR